MSFISTRGGACATASQAILRGIAPGGGLFVPSFLPKLEESELADFLHMDYAGRAATVLHTLLDDFALDELRAMTREAYQSFSVPEVAKIVPLRDGVHVLELFHGPTLAFKDMALQLLPRLMASAAQKCGETREVQILVATSGDTGKAALEGFKDVPGVRVCVFYPEGGVSRVQRLQMTTTAGRNTRVIAVRGNFDDAQTGVKKLFTSLEYQARMDGAGRVMSSANSINLGRLAPQIAYYFSACADLLARGACTFKGGVNVCVPTGNFGNILAAWCAKRMGAPIRRLICASNRNDVLTDFLQTGEYVAKRPFYRTVSPSMDILVSSNLERLLFELAERRSEPVCGWMDALSREGRFRIDGDQLASLQAEFTGYRATDEETLAEIARVYTRRGMLVDPHTAVAAFAARKYLTESGDRTPMLIVATASPYKFAPDVASALFPEKAQGLSALACAELLEKETGAPMPPAVRALESLPVLHTRVCDIQEMGDAVLENS